MRIFRLAVDDEPLVHRAVWAGFEVHSSLPLPGTRAGPQRALRPPPVVSGAWQQHASGSGWLAGQDRSYQCSNLGRQYRLQLEGLGEFFIDAGAGLARCRQPAGDPADLEQAFIGPCTALLMAEQDVFQLHASAIGRNDGRTHLLLGRSGVGKSTLAARAAAGWQRLADDIVAVDITGADLRIPGPVPQLKLDEPMTPIGSRRVNRIHLLTPSARNRSARQLSTLEATLALSRHSVAARLFSPHLLSRHLAFCGRVAERVPVYMLEYRQEPEMIQSLLSELTRP